jgi:hypothetical protein
VGYVLGKVVLTQFSLNFLLFCFTLSGTALVVSNRLNLAPSVFPYSSQLNSPGITKTTEFTNRNTRSNTKILFNANVVIKHLAGGREWYLTDSLASPTW